MLPAGIRSGPLPASFAEPPTWLFKAGPTSTAMREAEDCLSCRVSGAVWIKKLTDQSQAAGATASAKKRAKTADLTEDKPQKKAKVAAKAKAKAPAKGSGKAKSKSAPSVLQQGETSETLQEDMSFGAHGEPKALELPAGTRQRIWLDDLIAAISAVVKNHFAVAGHGQDQDLFGAYGSTEHSRLVAAAFSCGLKFCLEGKVKIEKKVLNQWSRARPAIQHALKKELDKLTASIKAALPSATNADDMVKKLASEIHLATSATKDTAASQLSTLTGAQTQQAALAAAKTVMNDKEIVLRVEKFVERNNSSQWMVHMAFMSMFKQIRNAVCTCPGVNVSESFLHDDCSLDGVPAARHPAQCSFHNEAHTLEDFLMGLHTMAGMSTESTVPADAELLGAASLVVAGNIVSTLRNQKKASASSSPNKKAGVRGKCCCCRFSNQASDPMMMMTMMMMIMVLMLMMMMFIARSSSSSSVDM